MPERTQKEVQKPESSSRSFLLDMFSREAVLIALGSGAFYLFAYFHQQFYLAHFRIPSSLIELNITRGIVAVAGSIVILVSAWYYLSIMPTRLTFLAFRIFLVTFPLNLFYVLAVLIYWSSGFSWFFIVLVGLCVAGSVVIFWTLATTLFQGGGFSTWLESEFEREINFRSGTVSNALLDRLDKETLVLIFLCTVLPYGAGSVLGKISAGRQVEYLTVSIEKVDYAIISKFGDQFVLSSYRISRDDQKVAYALGEVSLKNSDELATHRMHARLLSFKRLPSPKETAWVSWSQFWNSAWGAPSELDRR